MHVPGNPAWRVTVDTSEPMLVALYLRDIAGLEGAGHPCVAKIHPHLRPGDHSQLTAHVGGTQALRDQWEFWWRGLLAPQRGPAPELDPPDFLGFAAMPALQRVLQAHYGTALAWTREQAGAYRRAATRPEVRQRGRIFAELVQNQELELGRTANAFSLTIVEMPLSENRAWFVEPDRVIMSQDLWNDRETFVSFLQPVVQMLA